MIRCAVALGVFALPAHAPPLPALPMLPSIARVNVTSHAGSIAIVEDVLLPRGDWHGEPLRFHVAFGAPGPRAIDVRLVPIEDGALEPTDDAAGEPLTTEKVARRPANAHALLGRETMAGIVVTVPPTAFGKALARGQMAALRVRSLVDPAADAAGSSSVVVRLGVSRGPPLSLGRIVAGSAPGTPPLTRVEARLCGSDADTHPLAVHVAGAASGTSEPVIAPILAVRHASDDLCLRFWRKG